MARWGGVGSHRYPTMGFSGDVDTSWESLAFQPYFASTAANVGFYWTFDLGGFSGQPDAQLFTRWMQWGLFSPILRTHCMGKRQGGGFTRDIWQYPFQHFELMRQTYVLRSKLVPYIYSANFVTYQTGQALLRPLYYAYPENEEAYEFRNEYFFGNDMIAAPITSPGDQHGVSSTEIWIPPGVWIEYFSGKQFTGPARLRREFLLREIPVYVRAGSVIPTRSPGTRQFGSAQEVPESLELIVYPGLSVGEAKNSTYYDDDGITTAYTTGAYALTTVQVEMSSSQLIKLTIFPFEGKGFPEMPERRNYQLQFLGMWPASSVTVNGASLPHSIYSDPNSDSWTYDGTSLSVCVNLATKFAVSEKFEIELHLQHADDAGLLRFGFLRNVYVAQEVKDLLDDHWGIYVTDMYPHLLQVAVSSHNATVDNVFGTLRGFHGLWQHTLNDIKTLRPGPGQTKASRLLAMA